MPQPADDDPTVRLTPSHAEAAGASPRTAHGPATSPPAPAPDAATRGATPPRRVPLLAIALPTLVVILAMAGALYLWKAAPTPSPATASAPAAASAQATASAPAAAPIASGQVGQLPLPGARTQTAAAPADTAVALASPERGLTPARPDHALALVTPALSPGPLPTGPLPTGPLPTGPLPPAQMSAAPLAPTPPVTPQPSLEQHGFRIETGTEQSILDHVPSESAPDLTVFRFKPNPRIIVLDFTSLREQGRMLNRAAALIEKSGLPHDRLLTEVALDDAIRAGGDTVETFYYGHDYSSGELIRFFALAERDNIALLEEEDALGRLMRQEGWFDANARGGLISIPQVGADAHVTRAARATILHHELSHGEYFTNPAYAAFVHRFWTQTLSAAERDRIRRHLQSEGYDSNIEEVMENEAQAYLMFTDSPEFFTPDMIGMSNARLAELRGGFYRAMPAGWLRDSLGQSLTASRVVAHP